MPRLLIITGEASGDLHGANLATALRSLRPDIELLGIGGENMRAAGVTIIHRSEGLDTIGLVGIGQVLEAWKTYKIVDRAFQEQSLDAVVLIDHPGVNLHLARLARRRRQRVIYYISPQVWAWKPGRIRKIQRNVDHMLVILPFEEAFYREAGVSCTFVGHPLLDAITLKEDRSTLRRRFGFTETDTVIGLLPGSRKHEVSSLFPIMLESMVRLRKGRPGLKGIVAQAQTIGAELLTEPMAHCPVPCQVVRDQANEVMAAADLLLVASGTATLQAALIGTPMIIMYRAMWFTTWLAKQIVLVPYMGLVNLVAGRKVVPELLQQQATVDRVSAEAERLLADPQVYEKMKADLRRVQQLMGQPGASLRAAEIVIEQCKI
jgi:lipid-A-disaccharide synthase